MKIELSVVERILLLDLFRGINSPMSLQKIWMRDDVVADIELTEEEKETVGFRVVQGPVPQITFNQEKAKEMIKEIVICPWAMDLIRTWLQYSDLLDDFKPSHQSLYEKFAS